MLLMKKILVAQDLFDPTYQIPAFASNIVETLVHADANTLCIWYLPGVGNIFEIMTRLYLSLSTTLFAIISERLRAVLSGWNLGSLMLYTRLQWFVSKQLSFIQIMIHPILHLHLHLRLPHFHCLLHFLNLLRVLEMQMALLNQLLLLQPQKVLPLHLHYNV